MTSEQSNLTASSSITGIQQVGIGVEDAYEAFIWYNRTLGLNVPVFDDIAKAKLMTPHTNGVIRERRAILAVNMAGGGGAEIWQSKAPLPIAPVETPQIGDLGIFAIKIKAADIALMAQKLGKKIQNTPENKPTFWIEDPYKNTIQLVEDNSWFKSEATQTGGILGVVLGVSDMEKSVKLYREVLGINELVYDKTGTFDDLKGLANGEKTFRRVLLRKEKNPMGAFTNLFGNIEIELVQALDYSPKTIFKDRSWGDLGYIHVCFDVIDMEALKNRCEKAGYAFTVDSANSFDMGEAAGRFSYIADPDGTLVEFVETHKVPVMKKIGWYINLKKRKTQKPLPNWMVATIGWGKVKV